MKDQARPVKPTALGAVGEDHFRTMVDNGYRIDGLHWYKRTGVVHDGAPWLVEAFLAETETGGGVFHLVNHSPVREDPLARTVLRAGTVIGWGIGGYLDAAKVDVGQIHTAVVHLVCPAPTFLDRGKATLAVPDDVSPAVAEALWRVAKATYRASKEAHHEAAHERRRAQRREADKPARTTLRDAVFAVMQEGFDKASGGLPTDKRSVY
jgi:hypothetical protein